MAQMLFYENVTPVSPQRHGDLSVEISDYEFAGKVNSVPVMAAELPAAASDYTIVFAGNEESVTPVVILGIEDGTNAYVGEDGVWAADYIPAFVRRYPFVFSQNEDKLILCVDENHAGCNREGKGQRLFDDKGERSDYLSAMLRFLEESQTQFARTRTFCQRLKELDLLEPMQADITMPSGEKKSLRGFMVISREKLKNLAPEKLSELVKTNELELAYIHLLSMNNFRQVSQKQAGAAPAAPADGAAPAAEAVAEAPAAEAPAAEAPAAEAAE
jgi:hypothetical protein